MYSPATSITISMVIEIVDTDQSSAITALAGGKQFI